MCHSSFHLNSGKVEERLVHSKPLQVLLWGWLDPFPSEEGFIWDRNLVVKQNRVKWQTWRWFCTGYFEDTLTATGLPGNNSLGSVEMNWLLILMCFMSEFNPWCFIFLLLLLHLRWKEASRKKAASFHGSLNGFVKKNASDLEVCVCSSLSEFSRTENK